MKSKSGIYNINFKYDENDSVSSINYNSSNKITSNNGNHECIRQEKKDSLSEKGIGNEESGINKKVSSSTVPSIYPWNQIFATIAVALAHFNIGVSVGYPGVMLPALTDHNSTDIYFSEEEMSLYSSIVQISAMLGGYFNGVLTVYIGQRWTLISTLPIVIIMWTIHAFSPYTWLLIVCRTVIGFCQGTFSFSVYSFTSEIAEPKYRGILCGIIDVSRQFGVLIVFLTGIFKINWRYTSIICGVPAALLSTIALLFMKDSPRWLILRNRSEDAMKSLMFYRTNDKSNIEKELKHIIIQLPQSDKRSFWTQMKLMKDISILKRMCILFYILTFMQFTGNIIFVSYTAFVFDYMQLNIDIYKCTLIVGIMRVMAIGIYMCFSMKVGRKTLVVVTLFLCGVSMLILSILTYFHDQIMHVQYISWVYMLLCSIFIISICNAVPVTFLYRNELIPNSVRPIASVYFSSFLYGASFLILQFFHKMYMQIGLEGCFMVFGINNLLLCLFSFLTLPETINQSLEAIDDKYRENTH